MTRTATCIELLLLHLYAARAARARDRVHTFRKAPPRRRPSNRVDQCVTPYFFGGGFSVVAMTLARSTLRGRPERGSSTSPARPPRRYRSRHAITVGRETPTRCAISVFDRPCPPSSTIRARCASPAGTVGARVHRSSSTRSLSTITKAGAGRFAIPHHRNNQTVKQLTTRATRPRATHGRMRARPPGSGQLLAVRGAPALRTGFDSTPCTQVRIFVQPTSRTDRCSRHTRVEHARNSCPKPPVVENWSQGFSGEGRGGGSWWSCSWSWPWAARRSL